MIAVYKYKPFFRNSDVAQISLPQGAQILRVATQKDRISGLKDFYIWALVDIEAPLQVRHIRMAGTGHPINEPHPNYIDSVDDGPFVWHFFEVFPND